MGVIIELDKKILELTINIRKIIAKQRTTQ